MIWGGRWERGSGLGTHVHPWLIHVNVWQNQNSTVKQNKVKNEKKIKKKTTTKIMASGPITSWEIDGETMETVTDFTFLHPKIIADGDIKKCLLLGRKAIKT